MNSGKTIFIRNPAFLSTKYSVASAANTLKILYVDFQSISHWQILLKTVDAFQFRLKSDTNQ